MQSNINNLVFEVRLSKSAKSNNICHLNILIRPIGLMTQPKNRVIKKKLPEKEGQLL